MSAQDKKEKKKVSRLVTTSGAMVGGALEAIALQPLDVLKTRLQLGGSKATLGSTAASMFRTEGALSFYKGLTPFVTHLVTKYSVRWYFNDFYRGLLKDKQGNVSTMGGFMAGLGAGMTEAVLIVTPFEVIKTRLQQQKGTDRSQLMYKGPIDCATKILKEEGVLSLWKGNTPTMVRQGWNQFFLFGTYEPMKKLFFGLEKTDPVSPHQSLLIGVVAGALGPLTNNPFDVAKTRLMAQREIGAERKYTGMFQCIFKIFREEGFLPLMRGCGMRIARVAPGMGITFTVVEKFTQYFS
jgi:solute carrier family 25 citrate transporter 1